MLRFTAPTVLTDDNESLDLSSIFPRLDLREMSKGYKVLSSVKLPIAPRIKQNTQVLVRPVIRITLKRFQEAIEAIGQEVLDVTNCKYPRTHFRNGVWIAGGDLGNDCQRFAFQMACVLFFNANPQYGYTIGGTLPKVDDPNGHQLFLNYTFIMRRFYEASRLPLFDPRLMPLIARVRLRNVAMEHFISLLSLPYEHFEYRHFGEIFEKLQSFTGITTKKDTYQVRKIKHGKAANAVLDSEEQDEVSTEPTPSASNKMDPLTPCWFMEVDTADSVDRTLIVHDNGKPVIYPRGTFLYRHSTRAQEQAGAFYTPYPLAETLVRHTINERCDNVAADEILNMNLLEPAMGAGSLLIELINQLADRYLERKQDEINTDVPQSDYYNERQRVRRYVTYRNSHGVDLNAGAVEIAQLCLWINSLPKTVRNQPKRPTDL